jgi:hypothetical protein
LRHLQQQREAKRLEAEDDQEQPEDGGMRQALQTQPVLHVAPDQRRRENEPRRNANRGDGHPAVVGEKSLHAIGHSRAQPVHDARRDSDLDAAIP